MIHRHCGEYPFGRPLEGDNTFMQLTKQNLTEEAITEYRLKVKHFKEMQNERFIKLIRLLKEDQDLHFIYEYRDVSLMMFIQQLSNQKEGHLKREEYKEIEAAFRQGVGELLQALVVGRVCAHVSLSNMAWAQGESSRPFQLKVFLDLDSEFLELNQKQKTSELEITLNEFYEPEMRRLVL